MSKKAAAEVKTKQPVKEEKPEAPPEEKAEPEKPTKVPKPEKKKRIEKKIFTLYKVEDAKVTRLRPICERCGLGYFMAEHSDRYTCGHCGFTRYKPAENKHA